MNSIIKNQLNQLKILEFQVDNKESSEIPESFSEIVFFKNKSSKCDVENKEYKIKFEDYVLQPFMKDFHNKFNNGCVPQELIMYGIIIKESEKMNYIKVRTLDNLNIFEGWIPKKSMHIL